MIIVDSHSVTRCGRCGHKMIIRPVSCVDGPGVFLPHNCSDTLSERLTEQSTDQYSLFADPDSPEDTLTQEPVQLALTA